MDRKSIYAFHIVGVSLIRILANTDTNSIHILLNYLLSSLKPFTLQFNSVPIGDWWLVLLVLVMLQMFLLLTTGSTVIYLMVIVVHL
jgi:hypothetical protein